MRFSTSTHASTLSTSLGLTYEWDSGRQVASCLRLNVPTPMPYRSSDSRVITSFDSVRSRAASVPALSSPDFHRSPHKLFTGRCGASTGPTPDGEETVALSFVYTNQFWYQPTGRRLWMPDNPRLSMRSHVLRDKDGPLSTLSAGPSSTSSWLIGCSLAHYYRAIDHVWALLPARLKMLKDESHNAAHSLPAFSYFGNVSLTHLSPQ